MAKEYSPKELKKWLDDLSDEMTDDFNEAVKLYTAKIAQQATEDAPYDTGLLAGSIKYKINTNRTKFEGVVEVGAEYGIYVEFGSAKRNKPAQPFLYPAYNKYSDDFYRMLMEIMETNLGG